MMVETELEELLQFFYLSPVGLVETDDRGQVQKINPMAVRLLAPLGDAVTTNRMSSLLPLLEVVAPGLVETVRDCPTERGALARDRRFLACTHRAQDLWVELRAVRIDRDRVMFVVLDCTEEQRRATRELRHAREMNDDVVQAVVAAEMALDMGRVEDAQRLLADASRRARRWVGEMLRAAGPTRDGDLVRTYPSSAPLPGRQAVGPLAGEP